MHVFEEQVQRHGDGGYFRSRDVGGQLGIVRDVGVFHDAPLGAAHADAPREVERQYQQGQRDEHDDYPQQG